MQPSLLNFIKVLVVLYVNDWNLINKPSLFPIESKSKILLEQIKEVNSSNFRFANSKVHNF
jgi:hypothetical protein